MFLFIVKQKMNFFLIEKLIVNHLIKIIIIIIACKLDCFVAQCSTYIPEGNIENYIKVYHLMDWKPWRNHDESRTHAESEIRTKYFESKNHNSDSLNTSWVGKTDNWRDMCKINNEKTHTPVAISENRHLWVIIKFYDRI